MLLVELLLIIVGGDFMTSSPNYSPIIIARHILVVQILLTMQYVMSKVSMWTFIMRVLIEYIFDFMFTDFDS